MPWCEAHDQEKVSLCCGAPIVHEGFCAKCRDYSDAEGTCWACVEEEAALA